MLCNASILTYDAYHIYRCLETIPQCNEIMRFVVVFVTFSEMYEQTF